MTAVITIFMGSNFLQEKSVQGRAFPRSYNSYQVAELGMEFTTPGSSVCVPSSTGSSDWQRDEGSSGKSPQTSDACSDPRSAFPPLPPWPIDPTHSDGSNRRDSSKTTRRSQEMQESWSTGELSQEVQRPISRQRPPQLTTAHPTLCTTGRPSPLQAR